MHGRIVVNQSLPHARRATAHLLLPGRVDGVVGACGVACWVRVMGRVMVQAGREGEGQG